MIKILLSFLLLCGIFSAASAQEDDYSTACYGPPASPRVYIGLSGGYGRIFHTEGISNPLNSNQNFDAARSNSFFAGFCAEYFLGPPKKGDWAASFLLKAYYSHLNAAKSTFLESEPYTAQNGQTSILKTENTATFKTSFINTELLYFRYFSNFSIGGGFGSGFPLTSSIEKQKEILEPENIILTTEDKRYRTDQDGRALVFEEEDITNINFYAKVGIQYDLFSVNRKARLTPSVFYNFGLNKSTSTESFKINSLQFGLDFKAGL
ncbi:MAG: hypothetical protein V4642_00345 [Bacteroidota bacterium]